MDSYCRSTSCEIASTRHAEAGKWLGFGDQCSPRACGLGQFSSALQNSRDARAGLKSALSDGSPVGTENERAVTLRTRCQLIRKARQARSLGVFLTASPTTRCCCVKEVLMNREVSEKEQ